MQGEKKGEKFGRILKGLLLVAVAMQIFLSVYAMYADGSDYYTLTSYGNILNMGLMMVVIVYLFLSYYIWGQRERLRRNLREYLRLENLLLALFLVWMYLSGFYHLTENPDVMSLNAISYSNALLKFLLFFLLGQYLAGNKKILHLFFNALVMVMTVYMIYVLIRLVCGGEFSLPGGGRVYFDEKATVGLKRLGVNDHPNITGMYAKTLIMLCLYMFVTVKQKYRYVYLAAAAVHYVVLTLTSSRAAIIAAGIGVGSVAMLAVWRLLRQRKWYVRFPMTLISFCLVFFMFLIIRIPMLNAYNYLRERNTSLEEASVQEKEIEFREIGNDIAGRQVLFWAAIRSMRDPKVAVFGLTPVGIATMLNETTAFVDAFYTHNEFLEIMCAVGIPGLLFYLAWMFCIAKKGWIICYDRNNLFSMQEGVLVIICMTEILNNMMEARLTFFHVLPGLIFYLTAGYILTDERKRHLAEK